MDEQARIWAQQLQAMLIDFRQRHPDDVRSYRELLESLMEHFYESGLVRKGAEGKYIWPDIERTIPLIN